MRKVREELRALPESEAIYGEEGGWVVIGKRGNKDFVEFCFSYWDSTTQLRRLQKDAAFHSMERLSYKTFLTIRAKLGPLLEPAYTG